MTHLHQIMLEELERRNYAQSTIRTYIRTVEHYSQHFHRSPDQLGLEHIREYQAAMFRTWKLAPNTVAQRLAALRFLYIQVLQARLERGRDALSEEGPAPSGDPDPGGSRTSDRCGRDAVSAHPGDEALCDSGTPGGGCRAEGERYRQPADGGSTASKKRYWPRSRVAARLFSAGIATSAPAADTAISYNSCCNRHCPEVPGQRAHPLARAA